MAMLTTWRIAWRNLWRNRRRTALGARCDRSVGGARADLRRHPALGKRLDGRRRSPGRCSATSRRTRRSGGKHTRDGQDAPRCRRDLRDGCVASRASPAATARVYAPALAALGEEGFAVMVLGVDIAEEAEADAAAGGVTAPSRRAAGVHGQAARRADGRQARRPRSRSSVRASTARWPTISSPCPRSSRRRSIIVNRQAIVMPLDEAQAAVRDARRSARNRRSTRATRGRRQALAARLSAAARAPRRRSARLAARWRPAWSTCVRLVRWRGSSCSCWSSSRRRPAWRTRC